jgi:hypothetical protein
MLIQNEKSNEMILVSSPNFTAEKFTKNSNFMIQHCCELRRIRSCRVMAYHQLLGNGSSHRFDANFLFLL